MATRTAFDIRERVSLTQTQLRTEPVLSCKHVLRGGLRLCLAQPALSLACVPWRGAWEGVCGEASVWAPPKGRVSLGREVMGDHRGWASNPSSPGHQGRHLSLGVAGHY